MQLGLEAFYRQSDMDYASALPYLNEMLMKCLGTQDAQKGLMAFMTKKNPIGARSNWWETRRR